MNLTRRYRTGNSLATLTGLQKGSNAGNSSMDKVASRLVAASEQQFLEHKISSVQHYEY